MPKRRGRPPKYGTPSRIVAMTLPADVVDELEGLHDDLGWAIVRLVEQRRADTTRIENRFQPARGEVLNLLMAQLDPVTLGDAGADVAHDLFDINVRAIRLFLRAWLGLRTALLAASIGAAATPVELPA